MSSPAGDGPSPETYLALLRGVNVGGKNILPMKALVEFFDEAGCPGARTYIQSGNVVFHAHPSASAALAGLIASRIEASFGYRVPVILRTAGEIGAVLDRSPFLAAGADVASLHVMFLADEPDPARVAALDPLRSTPDEFAVVGREVHLMLTGGAARTKLTNAHFDAKLATVSTSRNWRTISELHRLMRGS